METIIDYGYLKFYLFSHIHEDNFIVLIGAFSSEINAYASLVKSDLVTFTMVEK